MELIHSINRKFNAVFSVPLYFVGMTLTVVLLVSPYWMRMFLAFSFNVLFNRPAVYFSYFGKFVGKRMNRLVVTVFYLVVFGAYSLGYRVAALLKGHGSASGWKPVAAPKSEEEYFYQS